MGLVLYGFVAINNIAFVDWLHHTDSLWRPARRGDRAMGMRFCFEITRGFEKCVKLALGHFLSTPNRLRRRAFRSKARSHFPATALCSCFFELQKGQRRPAAFKLSPPGWVVKLQFWGVNSPFKKVTVDILLGLTPFCWA